MKCPGLNCGAKNTITIYWSKTTRDTQTGEHLKIERWRCSNCGATFTEEDLLSVDSNKRKLSKTTNRATPKAKRPKGR